MYFPCCFLDLFSFLHLSLQLDGASDYVSVRCVRSVRGLSGVCLPNYLLGWNDVVCGGGMVGEGVWMGFPAFLSLMFV